MTLYIQDKESAEREMKKAEEAKWAGVPAWKRKLLEEKEKAAAEARAPEEWKAKEEEERRVHIDAMPEWKRNIVLKN